MRSKTPVPTPGPVFRHIGSYSYLRMRKKYTCTHTWSCVSSYRFLQLPDNEEQNTCTHTWPCVSTYRFLQLPENEEHKYTCTHTWPCVSIYIFLRLPENEEQNILVLTSGPEHTPGAVCRHKGSNSYLTMRIKTHLYPHLTLCDIIQVLTATCTHTNLCRHTRFYCAQFLGSDWSV